MTEEEEIQLTLDIHPGMKEGDQIKFDQIADEAVGHTAGDLIFNIKQVPHKFFVRNGDNLSMSMTISLLESLVGFKKTFEHLDGHIVTVEKKDVSYCSEVYIVKNEGMPKKNGPKNAKGDLLITLSIVFPRTFTEKQKELIKAAMA
jgi:DnaJ family protein B protein 11